MFKTSNTRIKCILLMVNVVKRFIFFNHLTPFLILIWFLVYAFSENCCIVNISHICKVLYVVTTLNFMISLENYIVYYCLLLFIRSKYTNNFTFTSLYLIAPKGAHVTKRCHKMTHSNFNTNINSMFAIFYLNYRNSLATD